MLAIGFLIGWGAVTAFLMGVGIRARRIDASLREHLK